MQLILVLLAVLVNSNRGAGGVLLISHRLDKQLGYVPVELCAEREAEMRGEEWDKERASESEGGRGRTG